MAYQNPYLIIYVKNEILDIFENEIKKKIIKD